MPDQQIYEHSVQFVPQGVAPHEATTIRTITFCNNHLDKEKVKQEAYRVAKTQRKIDAYALRNHWEVFHTEVRFNNPPWDGWDELCHTVMDFPGAKTWRSIENKLYVHVDDNMMTDFCKAAEAYFTGLNPQQQEPRIAVLEAEPIYR